MNFSHFLNFFTNSKFCLLAIGVGLIAIHLTLVWEVKEDNLLSLSIISWMAVCSLLSKKCDKLKLESSIVGVSLGIFIITIVLIKSQHISNSDFFLRLSPLVSALGVGLIASDIKGLKQYWRELFILCFLIPHSGLVSHLFDISKITAHFAGFLLWYLGFQISCQGVNLILPTGSVEVNPGCSGYSNILQLLGLSAVFLTMFPTKKIQKIILPVVALSLGFVVNGFRVALMAVLASSNEEAFTYWHTGDGSLIFSAISVLLFGWFCYSTLQQEQTVNQ